MAVAVTLQRVKDHNREEIFVHHAGAGHGTGYLEQEFNVYELSNGKFKLELKTVEILHNYPTAVRFPRNVDQESKFIVIPIARSSSRAIEETRSQILNGNLQVERRVFFWDFKKRRYVPSPFSRIEATLF